MKTADPPLPYDDAAHRWHAVQQRDAGADGVFWYAVRSTGVYCRPSCPSRPARRDNVSFWSSPAEAEAAGFRPCKRCRPDLAPASPHVAAIERACRAIETAETPPSLATLAQLAGLSRYHFHRVFKALTGVTPRQYAATRRAARLQDGLRQGRSVTAAYFEAGFGSSSRLYEQADALLGMKPGRYRLGGAGETIRFGVGQCALGAILVAATARGVCAIELGDDPQALVQQLQDRFPKAELIGGDTQFEGWMAAAVGLVEAPGVAAKALPLDVRGTAFQCRVWQALTEIPPGETASYAEIAARIGAPGSARAVARACAGNALAVAIPCHRVVRQDGGLSGYRWGVARKQALLTWEAGLAQAVPQGAE
ncbi:bifunctional DNA-binding transcriptional regulator/O6-methylguanine-DNA methyltransferase Ada [Chitiniphilus purpureus]|uniref:Bifunctional DNA-binding transcriptional regulator/O6-methylguanine-DNA methyltransferase Ada n=1 Tax=Chitiniphilus purpureus TaxID=2981137 RepID=A0ABY6DPI0_9NEIS|nr:bifunctional DNA-binding transcriptional regulator/O6-methylguanine-DNA methyltransferase Ada [Chitiniphilus sp. CD1]UXY15386.1 bifunctional DNA-binding transcriptional regulator/O6-methylguanine-DNA methyltransferase Ada [Chitiniphilus sp. CD1]